jgi:hypothetical protein
MQRTLPFDPPWTHTEYYNTGSNLRWLSTFAENLESPLVSIVDMGGLNAYVAGTTIAETWNQPVYGPDPRHGG